MKATRQSYGEALVSLGKENENIVVLDADLATATRTIEFAKQFPERFLDIGIAEADMIGTAAGLATCEKIPYVSTFAVFAAGRTYDQIRSSVCYPNLNVKICATHAGVTVGEDGATHQMIEDIALMRVLPNMKVFCPSDDVQTKWLIKEISKINGPCYVRLCRLATPEIYSNTELLKTNQNKSEENNSDYILDEYGKKHKFEIGKMVQIGEGTDATVFTTGVTVSEAVKAQKELKKQGIDIRVIDVHTIKPLDEEMIIKCAKETNRLICVEDHNVLGGLGSAISEVLTEKNPCKLERMGIKDTFGKSGKAEELLKYFQIDSNAIISKFL